MKNIVVPCDFSEPAINAYRFALDIAEKSKGVVHLLNVIELPVLHDSVLMPVLSFEAELLKELKDNAEKEFDKLTQKYKVEGVKVIKETRFGPIHRTIIDYVEEKAIDLVVMGSHGASGMRDILIGSNAERIVRRSPVPVMVIKDLHKGPIKRIVFPNTLDADDQVDLIEKVKELQAFFKAHLHIVWINTPLNFTSDEITYQRLTDFAEEFDLKDYTLHIYNSVSEEQGITQFTKMIEGNLIAMGTHGRKGISHFMSGSKAEDVTNHVRSLTWTYVMKQDED